MSTHREPSLALPMATRCFARFRSQ